MKEDRISIWIRRKYSWLATELNVIKVILTKTKMLNVPYNWIKSEEKKNGTVTDTANRKNLNAHHLECQALRTSNNFLVLDVVRNIRKKNIWYSVSRMLIHEDWIRLLDYLYIESDLEKKKGSHDSWATVSKRFVSGTGRVYINSEIKTSSYGNPIWIWISKRYHIQESSMPSNNDWPMNKRFKYRLYLCCHSYEYSNIEKSSSSTVRRKIQNILNSREGLPVSENNRAPRFHKLLDLQKQVLWQASAV